MSNGWIDEGMKMYVCENQGDGPRYWIIEWVGESKTLSITPKTDDFPEAFHLPFRSHVELRKRLYVEGHAWLQSADFTKYIIANPGDGGIQYNADGTIFHPKN